MTLQSIFDGEGFHKSPAQFVEIVSNWASQNRTKALTVLIHQLDHHSIDDKAEILVDWIDTYATIPQRDSCILFIMDAIAPNPCEEDDSDIYYDDLGYGHES